MSRARAWKTETDSGVTADVIIQNLGPIVPVCVCARERAGGRAADQVHLCFNVYVTRLTVFVSPRVIVCHRLCERLSVRAAVQTCARVCV